MTEHKIQSGTGPLEQAFQLAESNPDKMVVVVSAKNASRIIVGGSTPAAHTERQDNERRLGL